MSRGPSGLVKCKRELANPNFASIAKMYLFSLSNTTQLSYWIEAS